MLTYLLYFSAVIFSVAHGAGEFSVLTFPPSISFNGHDHLKQSLIAEVYSASVGFTTEQDSNWQGMYLSDPFNLAKAVVTVAIEGITDTGLTKGHHFAMKTDVAESDVFESVDRRIREHFPNSNNAIRVVLSKGLDEINEVENYLGVKNIKPIKLTTGALKMSVDEDRQFLEEMSLFNAIIESIKGSTLRETNAPQLIWFKVDSLHAICDLHGENSTATKEAKHLLNAAIEELNAAYNKLYNGRVMISVLSSDVSHTRRVRRDTSDNKEVNPYNLALNYSDDYPVIFNIILWFGVAMFFSLLAICMFIGYMDPGRDSIIYRMTSTRMKKDN